MFKLGIIGTGDISHRVMRGMHVAEGVEIAAVGSRSMENAKKFADEFGIAKAYPTYEDLYRDEDIDGVYIGIPHPFHKDTAMLALKYRKPVLLEKPFTVNAGETRELVEYAKAQDTLLMEAYWTRMNPVNLALYDRIIKDGAIGSINTMLLNSYMTHENRPPEHRLYDPNMAGGILMDIGIYPLAYVTWFLGTDPCEVKASSVITEGGWDSQDAVVFRYENGAMAVQSSSFQNNPTWIARIFGETGYAEIPGFQNPRSAVIHADGKEPEAIEIEFKGNGYEYEVMHFADCVNKGLKESPLMPLCDSVRNMELMDECRKQTGLIFPFEK